MQPSVKCVDVNAIPPSLCESHMLASDGEWFCDLRVCSECVGLNVINCLMADFFCEIVRGIKRIAKPLQCTYDSQEYVHMPSIA